MSQEIPSWEINMYWTSNTLRNLGQSKDKAELQLGPEKWKTQPLQILGVGVRKSLWLKTQYLYQHLPSRNLLLQETAQLMIRLTQALKAWLKKRHAHFQWLIPFSSVPIVRPMISGIQANIMRDLNKQGKKCLNILRRQRN